MRSIVEIKAGGFLCCEHVMGLRGLVWMILNHPIGFEPWEQGLSSVWQGSVFFAKFIASFLPPLPENARLQPH